MQWVNPNISVLLNMEITEYDIRKGNVSIMRAFQLESDEVISYLSGLSKQERVVRVGLLQTNNPEFAKALEAGFDQAVTDFIEANQLDRDTDILAIRKDAIFVINRPIRKCTFREHITFVRKNAYHAFIRINKVEIFLRERNDNIMKRIEVDNLIRKGPGYTSTITKLGPGMLSFIEETLEVAESSNGDKRAIFRFLREFCTLYKTRELEIEYYREFTKQAQFKLREDSSYIDYADDTYIDDIDIMHNFVHVIIPVIGVFI